MFENLEKFGDFSQGEIDRDSIIECPECGQGWGAKKWDRVSTEQEMKCPGCEVTFIEKTFFISYVTERPPSSPSNSMKPSGAKIGALATTKAEDKLIRKE